MLKPIDTSRWGRQDILREASLQSAAIARLGVWKRLAYSAVAMGVIVGIWTTNAQIGWGMPVAAVLVIVGGFASVVLTVGVSRAKRNVEHMLAAAGVDVDELLAPHSKKDAQRADGKR